MALGRRLGPARIRWFGLGLIFATATLGCSNTDKLPSKNANLFPTPRLPAPSNLDPATKATATTASNTKAPQWNTQPKATAPVHNPLVPSDQPQLGQQTPLGVASVANNPAVMTPTPATGSYGRPGDISPIKTPTAPVSTGDGTNSGYLPPIGLRDPMPVPPSDVTASAPAPVMPPTAPIISAPAMPNFPKP